VTSTKMAVMRMIRSWAAASALMLVYLCHVTANDAPARSRPPGMIITFTVFFQIICHIERYMAAGCLARRT